MKQITIIGNLGRDAEKRQHENLTFIEFSVGVNSREKTQTGTWEPTVEWFQCSKVDEKAAVLPYLTKGTKVLVQGTPSLFSYVNKKTGEQAVAMRIRVEKLELLSEKNKENAQGASYGSKPVPAAPTSAYAQSTPVAQTPVPRPQSMPATMKDFSDGIAAMNATYGTKAPEPKEELPQPMEESDLPF